MSRVQLTIGGPICSNLQQCTSLVKYSFFFGRTLDKDSEARSGPSSKRITVVSRFMLVAKESICTHAMSRCTSRPIRPRSSRGRGRDQFVGSERERGHL